ncbi:MAG: arylesterase [Candidatus Solibacter usitatus]|nr:arylesterase [Candidatus Solibacter usitatus]
MKILFLITACVLLSGCAPAPKPEDMPAPSVEKPRPVDLADDRPIIATFGDSLSAGFGVEPGKSYPDFLQKEIDRRGLRYRVVNAGVSGDTTTDGVVRLATVIALKPAITIVEFGGNDGMRGLPVATTESNLEKIVAALIAAGSKVVIAGMTLPPNYGPQYIQSFEKVFRDVAARHKVPLIPFLLEGVGGHAELMQRDGIHPTAEGNQIVAATVMRALAL